MAEAGENATPASMAAVASVIRNSLAAGGYGKSPSETFGPQSIRALEPRLGQRSPTIRYRQPGL